MAEKKATSAHTEQPGGPKGAFPPFDKTTFASQLFWVVICFVALYLLISRIAVPRIGGILDDRAKRIENDFAEAEKAIAATKTAAMGNVRGIAVDAAGAIVERLVGTAPAAPAIAAAVDEALKR